MLVTQGRLIEILDSLTKAREKAKQAEIESEVNTDNDNSVSKRKKTRKIYHSATSNESSDDNDIIYPMPPVTKLGSKVFKTSLSVAKSRVRSRPDTSTDEECITDKYQRQPNATEICSTPGISTYEECITDKYKKQVNAPKVHSTPGTSTDEECITDKNQTCSLQILSSLDSTLTPFLTQTTTSQALDVIAKHLARIETDIRDLQISQQEILQRLRSSSTPLEHSLPDGFTILCDDNEALNKIETWINTTENGKLLVTYLGLVGGNKVPVIIRRILEKLFTNKLAIQCNWTGKNNKIPLKDLHLIKIIRDAVRQNQIAENATDAEIHEVISNRFRFTKDRNGGREARRVMQ